MIQEKRVWELFSELVSIDNPSLREEKMCERIKIFLENLQIPYEEDDTGSKIGGTTGNLYAYVEGDNSLPPLLFSAHMDSVSPAVDKKPFYTKTAPLQQAAAPCSALMTFPASAPFSKH